MLKKIIIQESSDYLVVDKPAGILSQRDKSGDDDLVDHLKFLGYKASFLAPVHRLDRNTSGLLLLAKSSQAAAYLSEAMKNSEIQRKYYAIVKGFPGEKGIIDAPLQKDTDHNEVSVSAEGKEAITRFRVIEKMNATSLVELELETGRSHQIRAHMAHISCALLGDKKYAKKPWSEIFSRPALHAFSLVFPNPKNQELIKLSIPLPIDMKDLLVKLGCKHKY